MEYQFLRGQEAESPLSTFNPLGGLSTLCHRRDCGDIDGAGDLPGDPTELLTPGVIKVSYVIYVVI